MTRMSESDAVEELEKLSAMPAAAYVGSRIDGLIMTRVCTRCGETEQRSIAKIHPLMEREFLAWLITFSAKHAQCKASDPGEVQP